MVEQLTRNLEQKGRLEHGRSPRGIVLAPTRELALQVWYYAALSWLKNKATERLILVVLC